MWEKKPILLIVLATCAILVGTIVTMVLPFAWVNTEADRIEGVTPYTALQQEGRDVYIREGCNNCHTQTVRPLVSDVLRYGEYSKSGEFIGAGPDQIKRIEATPIVSILKIRKRSMNLLIAALTRCNASPSGPCGCCSC